MSSPLNNAINNLRQFYPELLIERAESDAYAVLYSAYFCDGPKTAEKRITLSRRSSPEWLAQKLNRGLYFTREAAASDLRRLLPAAERKFQSCLKAFNKLKESKGFDVSYSGGEDIYGAEGRPYLSFILEGFSFEYSLDR